MLKNIETANTFNYHFSSIIGNLGLDHRGTYLLSPSLDKKHLNTKNIKRKLSTVHSFSFQPIFENDVMKIIRDLKIDKSVGGGIPVHILKESEFKLKTLTNCMNMKK